MRQATHVGVGKESKKEERHGITLEDEKIMWEKGSLGCLTAKCLLDTIYFYNGKLFGLRSNEHRNLRIHNFQIDFVSVTYDETVSKSYHGGLKDLKYAPRVVRHVCCDGKDLNHTPRIVNSYASYVEKMRKSTNQVQAFYFRPHSNPEVLEYYAITLGINTLNKILPDVCAKAGLPRKTSHCLRKTTATRLFQTNVEEKLIRERTGHRSNALFNYEKKRAGKNCK
jgi:integrase